MGWGWREHSRKKGWQMQWQEAPDGLTEQRAEPGPGGKQEERKARGLEDGGWDGVGRSVMGLDAHPQGTAERTG